MCWYSKFGSWAREWNAISALKKFTWCHDILSSCPEIHWFDTLRVFYTKYIVFFSRLLYLAKHSEWDAVEKELSMINRADFATADQVSRIKVFKMLWKLWFLQKWLHLLFWISWTTIHEGLSKLYSKFHFTLTYQVWKIRKYALSFDFNLKSEWNWWLFIDLCQKKAQEAIINGLIFENKITIFTATESCCPDQQTIMNEIVLYPWIRLPETYSNFNNHNNI